MLGNEGDRLKRVVVCTPREEYFNVNNFTAQNINEIADRQKTKQQHDQLKSTMTDFGCEIIDVPELADHPNSVFTRDVALSTPNGYVKLRMGLETRKGEEEWMATILESIEESCAGEIKEPGTVEGGDIILAGSVAFVGLSERTNERGAQQISDILQDMNYEVRTISVKGSYLHLGGAMSAIGPERILCCSDVFPNNFFKSFDVVEVPLCDFNPSVGNVICLGENEVIANSAENVGTIAELEKNGVMVHALDMSEFRKGAGGPTCLILPVERK